jgi:hypothetical protein
MKISAFKASSSVLFSEPGLSLPDSKMKKVLVTILCLAFFMVNTGFVVNLHYCMNKLHSWEIGADQSEKCGKCGMSTSKTNDCCRDEVKVVKLQQDVVNSQAMSVSDLSQPFIRSFVSVFLLPDSGPDRSEYLSYRPPLIDHHKIYIEHRVFRI